MLLGLLQHVACSRDFFCCFLSLLLRQTHQIEKFLRFNEPFRVRHSMLEATSLPTPVVAIGAKEASSMHLEQRMKSMFTILLDEGSGEHREAP
jgi:hypothetical protein